MLNKVRTAYEFMLLPYEYGWCCISCGFYLIKRKHELTKIQRKKINFINRLNCSEHKIFCICVDVNKIYESNDYDKIYEIVSILKFKKIEMNNMLS